MPLTLKFVGALRQISGKNQLTADAQESLTLKELVAKLGKDMPGLEKILDPQQNITSANALVLVNGKEISVLNGLETKLCDGDEVVFIPIIHGG